MTPDRPDYKLHPLWNEAMVLAREAYAVAQELLERDPEAARRLRRAAVAVPAHLAGALSADEAGARESDAAQARASLEELASQAERLSTRNGSARKLLHHARGLARSVTLGFPTPRSFVS